MEGGLISKMRKMFSGRFIIFFFFLLLKLTNSAEFVGSVNDFAFNGFSSSYSLSLDGSASVTSNGLLELTTNTQTHVKSHAFYSIPYNFKSGTTGKTLSFSTTFVFAILPELPYLGGNGIAFLISPTTDPFSSLPSQYMGLFNEYNVGNSTDHIFAIELDTLLNPEFQDIDDNHVGIDINSLNSINSRTAGYYEDSTGLFKNLTLISGQPMQLWIDFDGQEMQLNVTLSPMLMPKPKKPLLSSTFNLTSLMLPEMYVGFASSSGVLQTTSCILGWSFKINGIAEALDYSQLPSLPRTKTKGKSDALLICLLITSCFVLLCFIVAAILFVRRRIKYAELLEDWELEYGPHRFSYKSLYQATKGFKDRELLGKGGFGRVYRGVLSSTNTEVAVKKVSRESRQGMKEFVAEIVSIGKLRHRNLVQLLGYCRCKGELLLVYDFMPNSSLDRFLFDRTKPTLNWAQRFRIIKGVASGLLYLHEDWEQVVIHRDIKASNVLLDTELNGKLGDFGLARLFDHGTDPKTTHIAGTLGYIAPELARSGKATTSTDVFAFGAFLLEVACGRRPIEPRAQEEEVVLIDWVLARWQRGSALETRDSRMGEEYNAYEVDLVLKLGLLCSNPVPAARPSMRQVVQFLEGDAPVPELPPSHLDFSISNLTLFQNEGFNEYIKSNSSTVISISGISGGR